MPTASAAVSPSGASLYSVVDCSSVYFRQREDPLTTILAGAPTGGPGPAIFSGVLLTFVEGLTILAARFVDTNQPPWIENHPASADGRSRRGLLHQLRRPEPESAVWDFRRQYLPQGEPPASAASAEEDSGSLSLSSSLSWIGRLFGWEEAGGWEERRKQNKGLGEYLILRCGNPQL